jgi:cellulose synthase/poly-beta-1,6-N-acetylglucosamine synthase-like glycosyltransferase
MKVADADVVAADAACPAGIAGITLIVPVRNEADTLDEFLASLDAQVVQPHSMVIVDAGSTDATRAILGRQAARTSRIRVVEAERCYPGCARNIGARAADTEWIAMTDAGTVVDSGWLARLVAALDRHPDVDVVFGTYEPLIETFFQRCVALCFLAPGRVIDGRRYRGPSTASLLVRKSVWEEVGGFPEDLRACEDLLFFRHVASGPYRTVCAPSAVVHWRLPRTFGHVFRRFRTYSHHTLRAGLGREWHVAVARMYAAAALVLVAAVAVHWSLILIPVLGLALRAVRSVRCRRDLLEPSRMAAVRACAAVGVLLLWIDLSALVGFIDYAKDRLSRT